MSVPFSESDDETLPPFGSDLSVRRLWNQMHWVTRISTALSANRNVEDIYSIILAGLLAPTGLGWSRAILFEYDPLAGSMAGRYALGHESLEAAAELAAELDKEEEFLERRSAEATARGDADPAAEKTLHALESGSEWITLFQRLNPDNSTSRRIERLVFQTRGHDTTEARNIFDEAPNWRRTRALSKRDLGRALPAALGSLLPEHFAATPIVSRGALRAHVFGDRHLFGIKPITPDDLRELDWFSRQASLAIENAELISDFNNAYDELKQFDLIKSNFVSVISHELRTPLTTMGGFLNLLLEERVGPLNPGQRAMLEKAARNTMHLTFLVGDLVDLSEMQVDQGLRESITEVEPLEAFMKALPRLDMRRRTQNVDVIPVVEGDVPRIYSNEADLTKILFHLIDNAMKFSRDGGRVHVRFSQQGGTVHISVIDEGQGIPREKMNRIFENFYQVDGSLTRAHEGLGLGLALTKYLIRRTKGQLLVESTIGKGSKFTVIYPVAAADSLMGLA
jgi:signal transduction histidine kinase